MIHTSLEHPSPEEFFCAVSQSFSAAANSAASVIDRDYALGGRTIRLRFAGPALTSILTPAIDHLPSACDTSIPDLTICVWDTESTGTGIPYLDVWNGCNGRGVVPGLEGSRISATRLQTAGVFSLVDASRGTAMYWAQSAADIPWYERGAPFRAILNAWWRENGGALVHAGSVGTQDGGVLLVGKGGSGKSTTALACMQRGMQYLGDDYCLILDGETPTVHSIYRSAKIKNGNTHIVMDQPPTTSEAKDPDGIKTVYFLDRGPSQMLASSTHLRAVLMPRVTGLADTRLVPATSLEAIHALVPSALFQLPDAGRVEFERMCRVVKQSKCYWLEAGTDWRQLADHVMEAIKG